MPKHLSSQIPGWHDNHKAATQLANKILLDKLLPLARYWNITSLTLLPAVDVKNTTSEELRARSAWQNNLAHRLSQGLGQEFLGTPSKDTVRRYAVLTQLNIKVEQTQQLTPPQAAKLNYSCGVLAVGVTYDDVAQNAAYINALRLMLAERGASLIAVALFENEFSGQSLPLKDSNPHQKASLILPAVDIISASPF